MCVCMCRSVCLYVYMCVMCMCVCLCVHKPRHVCGSQRASWCQFSLFTYMSSGKQIQVMRFDSKHLYLRDHFTRHAKYFLKGHHDNNAKVIRVFIGMTHEIKVILYQLILILVIRLLLVNFR